MSKPIPDSKRTIQRGLERVIRSFLKPGVSLSVRRSTRVQQPDGEVRMCWTVTIDGPEKGIVVWQWDPNELLWETGMLLLKYPQYRKSTLKSL